MNSKISRWLVFLLAVILVLSFTFGASANSGEKKGKENKHLASVNKFTGTLTTAVPINLPKYHGLAPNIKLTYSSHGKNGWVGVGWRTNCVSYIQRGTENNGSPDYDSNDRFYLGGQELVEDTSLGGTHSTEHQSYNRIEWDSANNKWYIWQKNGTKLTYEAINTNYRGTFRWWLTQKEDTNGNIVSYDYWTDNNHVYLSDIEYNGVKITFYSESRSDQPTYATGAGLAKMDYRLRTIDVQVSGNRARAYNLNYTISDHTNRSILSDVQQYGTDATLDNGIITGGTSQPKHSFEVTGGTVGSFNKNKVTDSAVSWNVNQEERSLTGDIDGDGDTDYILIKYCAPNSTYDYEHVKTIVYFSDGDGTYTRTENETSWGWQSEQQWLVGDANGDGKTDVYWIIGRGPNDTYDYNHIWMYTLYSEGDGTFLIKGAGDGTGETSWSWDEDQKWFPADANGDGKTDLYMREKGGPTSTYDYDHVYLYTFYSSEADDGDYTVTGAGNGTAETSWKWPEEQKWLVGDADGDGKDDLYWVYNRGSNKNYDYNHVWQYTLYATGSNGDFEIGSAESGTGETAWEWGEDQKWLVGDANGDGMTDLYWIKKTEANSTYDYQHVSIYTWYSRGSNGHYTIKGAGDGTGETSWYWDDHQRWLIGEANGDGKTDLYWVMDDAANDTYDYKHTWMYTWYATGQDGNFEVQGAGDGTGEISWAWSPYDHWLIGDTDGNGKDEFMRLHRPYHIEDTTVDASTHYHGLNIIREIRATGTNELKFRFRSGADGYSDFWTTFTLDQGTVSGTHEFAGGPITAEGSGYIWNGLVTEIKTSGSSITFEAVDPFTIDLANTTVSGYIDNTDNGTYIERVIGNGNQLTFKFEDGSAKSITLDNAVASGYADLDRDTIDKHLYIATDANTIAFVYESTSDNIQADEWKIIRLQPEGEKRLKQIVSGSNKEAINFIMEDLNGGNDQTASVGLSGVYAMEQTTANSNEIGVDIAGGENGFYLKYDDWDSWQGILLATTKTGYDFVEEDISLDTASTDGQLPDLIDNIDNGFGADTDVHYAPSSDWGNRKLPVGLNFATVDLLITYEAKNSNWGSDEYRYSGARYDFAEQEFRGFGYVYEEVDSDANYMETYYKQNDASAGKIDSVHLRDPKPDSEDDYYKRLYYTYSESSSAPYESKVTEVDKYQYNLTDSYRHVETKMSYDSYGNLITKKEYGDVDVSGDERTTVIDHKLNTTDYIVSLPKYKEIYEGIGTSGTKMKRTQYVYDGNSSYDAEPTKGLLTKRELWDDENSKYIDHEYSYDSYGNLTQHKNPLDNVVKELTYDSTYHLYIVERTNQLGHTRTKDWNYTLGKVTSITDANGNEITKSYDALGREEKISYPDGGYEEYDYVDWGNVSNQHVKRTTKDSTSDNLWRKTYFDGLHRTCKIEKDGGWVKEKEYDGTGSLVVEESYWYESGGTPKYIERSYDGLGRLTETTYPDGNSTSAWYQVDGKVTRWDEEGNKREVWKDAYGNTTKIREYSSYDNYHDMHYTYDVLGRITKLEDAKENTTTLTWDSLGRRQKIDDMDKGVITQDFNDAGQKISRTDAKSQTISYTYDAIGRLKTKEYPDGSQITQNYDDTSNCTNGDGRLTSVSYPEGSVTVNSYNFEGKATSKTKTIDGVSKTFDYKYDIAGRIVSLTYPDGETIDYNYNDAGRIEDIPGYVNNFDYNGEGKVITAEYANGVTENFSYDSERRWLNSAAVTNSSGTNLYEASYTRKLNGLITDYDSGTHQSLSFTYDGLKRLTEVSGDQSQTFSYDDIGNMTSNSQVGDYSYGNSNHVHAVTAAGSNSYSYDANGNMTLAPGKTINWDYEDRVSSIDLDSGDTISFAYDENGERILKETPTMTTRYFGKALKVKNGDPVKFIYAGKKLVAKKNSSGNKYWYHQDHLSSMRVITNENEEVVKDYDYRAYGKVEQSSGTLSNEFNFGGHIADDSTGLIYMGARYYEPTLGRFVSADNKIPQPGNPQTFNRYTYCQNNPVNRRDPNGNASFMFPPLGPIAPLPQANTSIFVDANSMTGSIRTYVPGQEAPLLSIDLAAVPAISPQRVLSNPNQAIDMGMPGNPARGTFRVGGSVYKGLGGGAYLIHELSKDEYYLFLEGGAGASGGVSVTHNENGGPFKVDELVDLTVQGGVSAGIAEAKLKATADLADIANSFQITPIGNVGGVDFKNLGTNNLSFNLNDLADATIPGGSFSASQVELDFGVEAKIGFIIPLSGSWYARNGDVLLQGVQDFGNQVIEDEIREAEQNFGPPETIDSVGN